MPKLMPKSLVIATLIFSLAAPAALAQSGEPLKRSLSVVGEGRVQAIPDMATVTLGVVTEAATADAALAENSAARLSMRAGTSLLKFGRSSS